MMTACFRRSECRECANQICDYANVNVCEGGADGVWSAFLMCTGLTACVRPTGKVGVDSGQWGSLHSRRKSASRPTFSGGFAFMCSPAIFVLTFTVVTCGLWFNSIVNGIKVE